MKQIIIATEVFISILFSIILMNCKTIDVEKQKMIEINSYNEQVENGNIVEYINQNERISEKTTSVIDIEPVIIQVETPIVLTEEQLRDDTKMGAEAVRENVNKAVVTPGNFLGGTQIYDYDENRQFPIMTKLLATTTIQLEPGERALGEPFLSDTLRWDYEGLIWEKGDTEIQLVIVKPLEVGLTTNMILITTKRLYQIILTSTKDTYMPMVRFRYPRERKFMESNTRKTEVQNVYSYEESDYVSYNYKIKKGFFFGLFAPEWCPTEVYDDGQKTYIVLPRQVLQKKYPTVYEENKYIVNYRVVENIIVIDKLIESCTLRLDNKRVKIVKKKGTPLNIDAMRRNGVEIFIDEEKEEMKNSDNRNIGAKYRLHFNTDVPPEWMPKKVYELQDKIIIEFPDGKLQSANIIPVITNIENIPIDYKIEQNSILIDTKESGIKISVNNQYVYIEKRQI